MTEVKRGMPPVDEVLSLLNSAYDGWGDEEYFKWKYDEYPDYDEDEHVFYIESEGDLAAYRRVFYKELNLSAKTAPVFVLGDTAVGKPHRGQGYYSTLHSSTIEYCTQEGADLAMTYNRKNNVTFKANRKRGWRYQTLPLNLLILSPSKVIERYARLALADDQRLQRLIDIGGDRINIVTSDGSVNTSKLIDKEPNGEHTSIDVYFSDQAVTHLVEKVTNEGMRDASMTALKSIVGGEISFMRGKAKPAIRSSRANGGVEITRRETVDDTEIDEILGIYDTENEVSFRRNQDDLVHLMNYPNATILLARQNGELTGFGVVGTHQNGAILEGRVLELRCQTDVDRDAMIDEAIDVAVTEDCDLVLLISDKKPGDSWAKIEMQTIMWDDLSNDEISEVVEDGWIEASLYDVA